MTNVATLYIHNIFKMEGCFFAFTAYIIYLDENKK